MPLFDVTIEVKICKTYRVEADNEDDATQEAHEMFTVTNADGIEDDYYRQSTYACVVVEEE